MATGGGEYIIGRYSINMFTVLSDDAANSRVYKGKHLDTGVEVDAKHIVPTKKHHKDYREIARQEIQVITSVQRHRNIVRFLDQHEVEQDGRTQFWIISELCSLGDLYDYANAHELKLGDKVVIMEQIASGLAYLHGIKPHPILHRDIKPDNILFMLDGALHVVKLCDFGVSRVIATSRGGPLSTFAGTFPYMAPEMFEDPERIQYSREGFIDVFAVALVFYQMIQAKQGDGIYCEEVNDDRWIGKTM